MTKPPKKNKEHSETREAPEKSQSSVATTGASTSKGKESMSEDIASIIEYTEDLSEAEAPVPLPPGDYTGDIRTVEIKESGKGNRYVQVSFFVDADQYPADYTDGNPEGTILSYGRLSPDNNARAKYNMKKFIEAIGGELGKSIDINDWVGKTAMIEVVNAPYDGLMQANIKKVKPA